MPNRSLLKGSIFLMTLSLSTIGLANPILVDAAPSLPSTGMNMQQVESRFGAPAEKQPSIGQPPITIWRYAEFNVYFERQQVLHSVRFVPYVRPMQIVVE